MECYKCSATLGPEDVCPRCGAPVGVYKKVIAISNHLYNTGLERAKVRDLSGAISALKLSLQYNKINIPARNLLGLIYFEMGETVSALSEWVISKNYMGKENPADEYLTAVQSSPALLNSVSQTIKKYNQALVYCQQGSKDLAIIQLKKVVSTAPKLVKAHQLLALLYMDAQKYDQARKSLRIAEQIDHNNTITMRYLDEIREVAGEKAPKKKKKKEHTVEYQAGNDTIIQPANLRDNTGWMMILNILVGVLIGVTTTYFLIVPNIRQNVQRQAGVTVSEANDTIAEKNQEIQELQDQIATLTKQVEDAQGVGDSAKEEADEYKKLYQAFQYYYSGDIERAGDILAEIEEERLDSSAKEAYESVRGQVEAQYLQNTYEEAYSEYMKYHYDVSADLLQKIVDLDDTYHDGDAIYYLAQSYRNIGEYEKAKVLYEQVMENYPNTYKATNSVGYLQQVEAHLAEE